MDSLVKDEFYGRHCDKDGIQQGTVNFDRFRQRMYDLYPQHHKALKPALKAFIREHSYSYCDSFPRNKHGEFLDDAAAFGYLKSMRPDLEGGGIIKIWDKIRARNAEAAAATTEANESGPEALARTTSAEAIHSLPPPLLLDVERIKDAEVLGDIGPTTDLKSLSNNSSLGDKSTYDGGDPDSITSCYDILARKLKQVNTRPAAHMTVPTSAPGDVPDLSATRELLKNQNLRIHPSSSSVIDSRICQAPLVAASIITEHYKDNVPQYGLLGSLEEDPEVSHDSQLFLNTNAPFSTFICGVQGSGKSHTTSCILENSILALSRLGHLQNPVSTLIFSYGEWNSDGAGFNISEAVFLGASSSNCPNDHVEKVTVLCSPSNLAIQRMYQRLPNVQTVPFRLQAKSLDIGAMHKLMSVDEKSTTPLYMATVEAILRDISAKSTDGSMDYVKFKQSLGKEKFDATQTNMLNMRLNLLESFLDLDGSSPVPSFKSGEITIMDLSDPFLTPSTACILFKLGLENFLQSGVSGKMVVLDEAHKYMINTPGSKIFKDALVRLIRVQRHQGARVIVSTQEPTIATDLIALCSVTIMHRFTSPAWYAALRKHIYAVENDEDILQRIEALETGEALIHCPTAVLGKNQDGSLIKATGRLMKVTIRNRVTLDGGMSIMAV